MAHIQGRHVGAKEARGVSNVCMPRRVTFLSKIKGEVVVKSASGQRGGRVGADRLLYPAVR